MEIKSYFAQDAQGNIMPSADCYLYAPGTTNLVSGLVDIAGSPLSNPFQASSIGKVQFGAPNGVYDLRMKIGVRDQTIRIQCADLLQALNETASFLGARSSAPTTRVDGTPLQLADRYLNTTDQLEYIYKSVGWVANNLDGQLLATSTGASLIGAVMQDGSFGTVQQAINDGGNKLKQELATSGVPIHYERTLLAAAVQLTMQQKLSSTRVDIWEFDRPGVITSKPDPNNPETWDWTPAFEAAMVYLAANKGGILTMGRGGIFYASQIIQRRFILIDGGMNAELRQIAGSNKDFLPCENFSVLTGSGLTVADSRVPSWYGLRDIRVNGNRYVAGTNPSGNTSGRGICYYGPAQLLLGTVHVDSCAGHNIYTEDANSAINVSWVGQEEGNFGKITSLRSGGHGWQCRGPHNSSAIAIICGFNGDWNFRLETGVNYGGAFDFIGTLHTYAGGRNVEPAADTGAYLGGIARIAALVTDGDNLIMDHDSIQVAMYRMYNAGGQSDGAVINANNCSIGSLDGVMWGSSSDKTAIIINGDKNSIAGYLGANGTNNDGVVINGSGNTTDLHIQNFSGSGRTGLKINGSSNHIRGEIRDCATGLDYVSGDNNDVFLTVATVGSQVPVAGKSPGVTDRINIRSRGSVIKGMKVSLQSAAIPIDTTVMQTIKIAHGMLYAPDRFRVIPNWMTSSPDSTAMQVAFLQVVSSDATNVVLRYKLVVAGVAGSVARISINIDMT